MRITVKLLKAHGACESAVRRFQRRYPNGVRVTEAACMKVAPMFNWGWAAAKFLSSGAYGRFSFAVAKARDAKELAERNAHAGFPWSWGEDKKRYNARRRLLRAALRQFYIDRARAFGRIASKLPTPKVT